MPSNMRIMIKAFKKPTANIPTMNARILTNIIAISY